MLVTDSEIQLLSNDDADLNENHVNIMRRLAVESNNDSTAMIERVSSIFIKSMQEDEDFKEILNSLMMSLRYRNDDIRDDLEYRLINIGLQQLQLSFEKVIELIPDHTDFEICKIFEDILNSDNFEQTLLETAKETDAYAELIVTIARYQLEQYATPTLIFSNDNSKFNNEIAELECVSCTPNLLP